MKYIILQDLESLQANNSSNDPKLQVQGISFLEYNSWHGKNNKIPMEREIKELLKEQILFCTYGEWPLICLFCALLRFQFIQTIGCLQQKIIYFCKVFYFLDTGILCPFYQNKGHFIQDSLQLNQECPISQVKEYTLRTIKGTIDLVIRSTNTSCCN